MKTPLLPYLQESSEHYTEKQKRWSGKIQTSKCLNALIYTKITQECHQLCYICFRGWICSIFGILGNHWSIMQISPVLMQDFIWKRVNSKKFTQLNTLKYAKGTQAYAWNFYQLPHFSMCVMSQTPVHLVLQLSIWFQITFFPLLARNTSCNPPDTTSTSKLQVFFRVKDHFFVAMYFLAIEHMSNSTTVFTSILSFSSASLMKFLVSCSLVHFSHMTWSYYCVV